MPLVSVARLSAYMNNPSWSEEQREEAEKICAEREARLGSLLNTPLTPIPWVETVAVLSTGLVATTYPVFAVTTLNGAAVPDGGPLPDGWVIQNNRLRATSATVPSSLTLGSLMPSVGVFGRVDGIGSVSVEYQAGWGPLPALVDSILEKAKAVMTNRHDDTITIRDLDAEAPAPEKEDWTDDEITKNLGIYRNLVVFR